MLASGLTAALDLIELTSPIQPFRRDQSLRLPTPTPPRVQSRCMSKERSGNKGQKRREYVALLVGAPLLLIGMWATGNSWFGFGGRHPDLGFAIPLLMAGTGTMVAGGYLIFRAR